MIVMNSLLPDYNKYKEMIDFDYQYLCLFKHRDSLPKSYLNGYEWKIIKAYRKLQANQNTIWKKYYEYKLHRLELKTGISFENNMTIGRGLIIAHWGSIGNNMPRIA